MNAEYVHNLRYKLQKRARRLRASEFTVYHFVLKQFWGFLQGQPLLVGIAADLKRHQPDAEATADRIMGGEPLVFDNEVEQAAVSCLVIEKCARSAESRPEIGIARGYWLSTNYNEMLEAFSAQFLEPFYEYIDEQLDDRGAILALLRRYKHKCEWFRREQLLHVWSSDTSRGERTLAKDMYEYLHDQGLDIILEPSSVSGEVDLIAAQKTEDPLIADVKIFNPDMSKGPEYIAAGFRQLYTYTLDYNEPFGYLIVFNTSGRDLRFALTDQSQNTPFVVHNNKTVFLLTIDISHYDKSASKRGPLTPVEITEADLIRVLPAPAPQQEAAPQGDASP
jgi:hypothetical protein